MADRYMSTLEDKLSSLLEQVDDLSRDEIARQATTIILHHAPKSFDGWPAFLRRIADFLDARPKPIMLEGKSLDTLLKLIDQGWHQ